VPIHHNRSLVINNKTTSATNAANGPGPSTVAAALDPKPAGAPATAKEAIESPPAPAAAAAASGWVAKRGKHMQLINASVYDQHVQDRTKAAAKTLAEKIKRKEALEKSKLNRLMQGSQGATRDLEVGGERYRLAAGGNKLVRVSGEDRSTLCQGHLAGRSNSVNVTVLHAGSTTISTPKQAVIGGVRFQRSRNGNLWRAGLVRASRSVQHIRNAFLQTAPRWTPLTPGPTGHHRRIAAPVKSTEPCKYYSTSGIDCLPQLLIWNSASVCGRGVLCGLVPRRWTI